MHLQGHHVPWRWDDGTETIVHLPGTTQKPKAGPCPPTNTAPGGLRTVHRRGASAAGDSPAGEPRFRCGLAWQPEAALAGAASGAFASAGPPTLAPIASSEAFLGAYQDSRGRLFSPVEQETAWAASVWTAAYNAREMALRGYPPLGGDALRAQAAERLRRANA